MGILPDRRLTPMPVTPSTIPVDSFHALCTLFSFLVIIGDSIYRWI